MMTAEQSFFIRLLRDYVHQNPSEEPETDIDWNKIVRYSVEQDVSGIIYYQTRNFTKIPSQNARKLKEGFLSNIYLSVNTDSACNQMMEAFDRAEIEYMPFKGMIIRQYYPHPELRTMGDRDILIHHKDRIVSDETVLSLEYEKFVDNHAVWTYYKKNIMFEIHDVLFYENLSNQTDYIEYFSHIWEHSKKKQDDSSLESIPDPSFHFIYSMAHTAKHVTNNGAGFRAFLDMVFFVINTDDGIDWDWIKKELIELKLYNFTKQCFSLCREWFDVDMPFTDDEADPVFIMETTDKVFRDGVFGLKNKENIASRSAKDIRRSSHGYIYTSLGITIRKLFPSYRNMQLIPWYKWVDGKPFLMPAAWIYRWFYCLVHKRKAGKDTLLEPYIKKENIDARKKYLDRWGL